MHRSLLEITFNGSPGAERRAEVFCVDLKAPPARKIPRPRHIGYGRFSRRPPGGPYALIALVFSGGSFEHAWWVRGQKPTLRERLILGAQRTSEFARRTPLVWTKQCGMLQCPRRRQRLEQIIKLKRAGLAAGEDCFNNVWRDQGQAQNTAQIG